MNKWAAIAASVVFAGVASVGGASAADLNAMPVKAVAVAPEPPPFDVAFGAKFGTDYVFRGITQTNGNPTVQGYAEVRAWDWLYAGLFMSNVDFPSTAGLTNASAEMDFYAGIRHTWGGFTGDLGFVYYYYPGQTNVGALGNGLPANDINYWELYFKPTYVFNDIVTVGGNLFYGNSYAGTGASDVYLSGTLKVALPNYTSNKDWGWYVSGELGYQWLGTTNLGNALVANISLPDYATWNAGVAFTYKAATVDFRYYGSGLNNNQCLAISGLSNACGDRYVASLSFDTSFLALK